MSEIPSSNAGIVRQVVRWEWQSDHDRAEDIEAIENALEHYPDIAAALRTVRRRYLETAEHTMGGHPKSWRDFRSYNACSRLFREDGFGEFVDACVWELECLRDEPLGVEYEVNAADETIQFESVVLDE